MIVGVTGWYASGKDTVAEFFEEQGFLHISLSDIIREHCTEKSIPITRENLIRESIKLRKELGPGEFARRALKKFQPGKNYVISSIRLLVEVEILRTGEDFVLCFVDAPFEERLRRLQMRNRENDPKTPEALKAYELRERSENPYEQQIHRVEEQANIIINNDKDVSALTKKLKKLYEKLVVDLPYRRPSWDEYFTQLAKVVGLRGTCDRGRAGSVIVKDKQILCTGYVGSPPGEPHCDDVGHLLKTVLKDDGSPRKHCVRTIHSEQNALIQAAKRGVSVEGATVYTKMTPCSVCARLLVGVGIKRVVAAKRYDAGGVSESLFKNAKIALEFLDESYEHYINQ